MYYVSEFYDWEYHSDPVSGGMTFFKTFDEAKERYLELIQGHNTDMNSNYPLPDDVLEQDIYYCSNFCDDDFTIFKIGKIIPGQFVNIDTE